jgi:hypothetical protein
MKSSLVATGEATRKIQLVMLQSSAVVHLLSSILCKQMVSMQRYVIAKLSIQLIDDSGLINPLKVRAPRRVEH